MAVTRELNSREVRYPCYYIAPDTALDAQRSSQYLPETSVVSTKCICPEEAVINERPQTQASKASGMHRSAQMEATNGYALRTHTWSGRKALEQNRTRLGVFAAFSIWFLAVVIPQSSVGSSMGLRSVHTLTSRRLQTHLAELDQVNVFLRGRLVLQRLEHRRSVTLGLLLEHSVAFLPGPLTSHSASKASMVSPVFLKAAAAGIVQWHYP